MDGLSIPAAGGVDTTAVIVGDFSNGNDAVILKDQTDLAAIKGQNVNLVEFSVSHYLLSRALETTGMSERDVKVVNTSDPDMVGAFQTPDVTAMVTWNPMVSEILALPGATNVFNSADIPGEIVARTSRYGGSWAVLKMCYRADPARGFSKDFNGSAQSLCLTVLAWDRLPAKSRKQKTLGFPRVLKW